MASPYTSVSISGYNVNPPPDDGTQTADNEISWAKHKDKIGDPLKNAIEGININVSAAFDDIFLNAVVPQSTNYTVQTSDRGALISATGTITITLLAAATAGSGFAVAVRNAGTGTVTVDGSGAETINGSTTVDLPSEASLFLTSDGSNWTGPASFKSRFPNVDADVTATDEEIDNTTKAISAEGDVIVGDSSGNASQLSLGGTGLPLSSDGTTVSYRSTLVTETAKSQTSGIIAFTGIASGARRITVIFDNITGSTTAHSQVVEIGDSGGYETSGYDSASILTQSGGNAQNNATDGFVIHASGAARSGYMVLTKISGNKWISSHQLGSRNGGGTSTLAIHGGGEKELSGELDRVRLTGSIDGGTMNIIVEK